MNDSNKTLAENRHPIDTVVKALEIKLLPEVENHAAALKTKFPDYIFETFSIRHVNEVHTLGLRCHSNKSASAKDIFSLHINVLGVKGISVRGFVDWNSIYKDQAGMGRRHFEAMTRSYKNVTKENLNDLYQEIPKLYGGLKRALERGHPPSRLERFWNRLTRRCDS
jgi:hypothetical protein